MINTLRNKIANNPWWIIGYFLRHYFSSLMSDEKFIKWEYFSGMGKFPNLEHPRTYNEKLQWLKLHDRRDIYTKMVDKFTVKEYVAGIIGSKYVIPTLGVWDSPNDIEWDIKSGQVIFYLKPEAKHKEGEYFTFFKKNFDQFISKTGFSYTTL